MANGGHDGIVTISTELDNEGLKKGVRGISGQLGGLKNVLKGVGAAVVAAFSVKAIAGFAKECIELGSAVEEVQNVVDVSFGSMRGKMEAFAKNAITSFGMSELAAKQTGSTYMAMAKGMGVAEDAASDMAIALTGLSGDVASFFNIDQEEAATKLKSVFTGETETLKSLGVVMTEANLKQYALAHGMNANISAMTQAERVALNYGFVMDSLSLAQGDFARTQGSWANQTRILSMQWQQLMATLGKGLTTVLLPVVKALNSIVAALLRVANAISAAFSQLFGGTRKEFSAASSGAGAVADAYGGIGSSASDAAEGQKDLAKGTKEAADAAKKSIAPFDEITQLQEQNAAGSGSGGGTGGGAGGVGGGLLEEAVDTSAEEGIAGRLVQLMDAVRLAYETLRQAFMAGFTLGWGDAGAGVENIKADLISIGNTLQEIFTDPAVVGAAQNFVMQTTFALGQLAGAAASVGVSIGENLVGGIAQWLSSDKDFIKETFVNTLDAAALSSEMIGNLGQAVAEVFRSLGSDGAKEFTGGLIGTIGNTLLGGVQTIMQVITLALEPIVQPIVDNAGKLREAFENVFSALAPITQTAADTAAWIFEQLNALYQNILLPIADYLGGLLSDALGIILDALNAILPSVQAVTEKFQELTAKCAALWDAISSKLQPLWDNILAPFISWLGDVFRSVWDAVFTVAGAVLGSFAAAVSAIFYTVLDILGGIIDFLTGIFEANWSEAWQTVKTTASNIWQGIKDTISGLITGLYNNISQTWTRIKTAVSDTVTAIRTKVTDTWTGLCNSVKDALNNLKQFFSDIWNGITGIVGGAIKGIKGAIDDVVGGITGAISKAGEFFGVAGSGGGARTIAGNFYVGALPDLANSFPDLHVPALARGAVLPANQPFPSIVGDQPRGTNVETPLATIEEAVANVMDQQLAAMMAGFEAVVTAIREKDMEINIGDETIGRAATRYQNRMAFIEGY